MKKLLLCSCFFSVLLSYASVAPPYSPSKSDSLSISVDKQPVVLQKKVSDSFIDKLESKFPISKKKPVHGKIGLHNFGRNYIHTTNKASETEMQSRREQAEAAFKKIKSLGKWVKKLTSDHILSLPVGIGDTIGNVIYSIGIVKATINPKYAELTVFAKVTLPQTDKNGKRLELFFGADDVKLSHQGGIVGDARLVLLGDVPIPFNGGNWLVTFNGGLNMDTGNSDGATYATIDCDGIKNLTLDGSVKFSRKFILPVLADGEVTKDSETRVQADFRATIENWNDLLVDVSLQPFTRAKKRNGKDYKGNFIFSVNTAVLDFSDLRNSSEVQFPEFYAKNNLLSLGVNTWRGVYVKSLSVKLPKVFKTTGSISQDDRVSFEAHHLIIDNYGLSGTFAADNLFQIKEGRTNKQKSWAYSLKHLEVSLAANHFVGAEFEGRIMLPVSKKNREAGKVGLRYAGLITQDEYMLNIATDSIIDFNIWKAEAQLYPNSSIELKVVDGAFRPKAILNGQLMINADKKTESNEEDSGESLVAFKGIKFQNLVLQTQSPLISIDYLGYDGQVEFGNFPVSISNIELKTQDSRASLWFDLQLKLMDGAGFGADTRLGILAVNKTENNKQKWRFDGIKFEKITVSADMGAFAFNGSLTIMNNDPEYGDGFSAELKATFKGMAAIEVAAKGIFGRVDGYRYWYFDASVDNLVPPGTVGVILLKGFAGGAYNNMKRKGFGSEFSPSGLSYAPDESQGLGVKAMVMCSIGSSGVVDAGAGFEILFNDHGGVSRLGFFGQAKIMADFPLGGKINALLAKVKNNTDALSDYINTESEALIGEKGASFLDKSSTSFPEIAEKIGIEAKLGVQYDFQNSTLHGELDIYVNVAGGVVEGRSSGGRAGWAVYHSSPDGWYLHMGTPTNRLGLKIGVGPISVETGGYFMVGDKIPASPPPPDIVAQILGADVQNLDYMRDLNALGEGRGFAFGADLSINTGELNFLILYASFQAGMGFDIMLKDYGDAACANKGGDQIGINGWYANGQSYAYLQGELGINVDLLFINEKIPIIKGSAAVLLQVMGPNPVWMRGYLSGSYNLLGGMVKGGFRFKLTIGEKCELMNASPLGGLKIISDVSPNEGSEKVDVFTAPQATFNMKVNEPIQIATDEGKKTFMIILEKFKLLHNGQELPGKLKWSTGSDRVTFVSNDVLPPEEPLKAVVQVSFKEYVDGAYEVIMVDGKKAVETEIRKFTTTTAPDYIPLENISYAYPVIDQKYFLAKEYEQGYIKLERGQDYLFGMDGWETSVKIKDKIGRVQTVPFHYDTSDNKMFYDFPNLKNDLHYKMTIVSTTGQKSTTSSEPTYKEKDLGSGNTVKIRQKNAETVIKDGAITRLSYGFSTSMYNTFKQKVRNINTQTHNWGKVTSDVIYLVNKIESAEAFGLVELVGNEYTQNKPLVHVEATLEDDYFQEDMKPLIYGHYPIGTFYLTDREATVYGIPPKKAVPIIAYYLKSLRQGKNHGWLLSYFPYFYNLPMIYKSDWKDLYDQIMNAYVENEISKDSPAYDFLGTDFKFMRYGKYSIDMQYILPGGIKGTDSQYDFKNELKFR